jgi:hypothetical protein
LIKKKVKWLKYELTKVFNKIILNCCMNPIIENLDNKLPASQQIDYYLDNFMKICCDLLEDKRFLCYYEEKFDLSQNLELVYQLGDKKM